MLDRAPFERNGLVVSPGGLVFGFATLYDPHVFTGSYDDIPWLHSLASISVCMISMVSLMFHTSYDVFLATIKLMSSGMLFRITGIGQWHNVTFSTGYSITGCDQVKLNGCGWLGVGS